MLPVTHPNDDSAYAMVNQISKYYCLFQDPSSADGSLAWKCLKDIKEEEEGTCL
jgi:hypothetical protein